MKEVSILTLRTFDAQNELNQLSLLIHRIDENLRPPDWHIDKVNRPYDVFWFVLSGTKKIIVDNQEFIVQKGDIVVFPSQTSFEIVESADTVPMNHLEIAIESKIGPFNLMTLYKFPIVMNLVHCEKRTKIVDLWKKLKDEWTPEKRNPFAPREGELKFGLNQTIELLQFNTLTLEWFVELLTVLRPQAAELSPTFDSRIQHLFHFINDNLAEKICLKTLADEVFLSESHLSLLFRKNLKMAPMEYVRKMRLKKVSQLLLTTNLSLKEISEMIGFENQSQLSRAFRSALGVSPTEYRKKGDFI